MPSYTDSIYLILKAAFLGIVEGLTEFLPVSSTGHLILVNNWISFTGGFANLFDIVIQGGAIAAVILQYRKTLFACNIDEFKKASVLWGKLLIAFLPAAAAGFMFHDYIESKLFSPAPVALALVAGSMLLFSAQTTTRKSLSTSCDEASMTYRQAVIIGLFQCLALWPGISRSAATIAGGLFAGLGIGAAARFSFFLAVPTLLGAGAFKLMNAQFTLSGIEWTSLATGTIVSFAVALAVIHVFISYLKRHSLMPFVWYRLALGTAVLVYSWWGPNF